MADSALPIRRNAAGIIDTGTVWLLQKRDDKDGIMWPGKVALWGGAMESTDESDYLRNMMRELTEETGLGEVDVELTCFGSATLVHQTMHGELVRQETKLFVARLKHPVAVHVYEGAALYELDPATELIDTTEFAPNVLDALEKLKLFYREQAGGR